MDPRDDRSHDSDSPTMPGTSLPHDRVGTAAQTPPPLSVTPAHHSPASPGHPVSPSAYASSVAATSITAFLSLQPGVIFGGRYEILSVLGQGGMGVRSVPRPDRRDLRIRADGGLRPPGRKAGSRARDPQAESDLPRPQRVFRSPRRAARIPRSFMCWRQGFAGARLRASRPVPAARGG